MYAVDLTYAGLIMQQMCVFVVLWVIDVFPLDAGLPDRGQYSEGPATGHLDTGFSWFPPCL
jgi:hypothetical protein